MGLRLAYRGQPFDMENPPTTDELLEHFVRRSRVPLEVIKQHPHGHSIPRSAAARGAEGSRLAAPAASWATRRCWRNWRRSARGLAAATTRWQCRAHAATSAAVHRARSTLLLVSRREHAVYNSVAHHLPALRRRRPFNPAYVNPADAQRLGSADGSLVIIESSAGAVRAVLQCAPDVREGVVSMAHGFEQRGGTGQGASTCGAGGRRSGLRAAQRPAAHERDPGAGCGSCEAERALELVAVQLDARPLPVPGVRA